MAWFSSVPIVDVHRENFQSVWPSIVLAIRSASFVALDAELSGLGPRRNLMLRSFDDRYKALCDVAKSHSILSLGLSCFKVIPNTNAETPPSKPLKFHVQTFNITLLCNEDYVVEPVALRFLVEHAFDFNKQYSQGVSYYRGQDKPDDVDPSSPRALLTELLLSNAPIILHNGLIDLAFLYQNLYCELPTKASQFICDLSEMFKGGVLDTKYVADFEVRMVASYLEYVFRKCQRNNARMCHEDRPYVAIEFPTYPAGATFVENHTCSLPNNLIDGPDVSPQNVCEQYAAHGHCVNGIKCSKSHDADVILDDEDFKDLARKRKRNLKKRQRRRKRGQQGDGHAEGEPTAKVPCEEDEDGLNGCHDGETEEDGESGSAGKKVDSEDMQDEESEHAKENARTSEFCEHTDAVMAEDAASQSGDTTGESDRTIGSCDLKVTPNVNESTSIKLGITETEARHHDSYSSNKDSKGSLLLKPQYAGCHRAGFDAFMTGFAMATFVSQYGRIPPISEDSSPTGSFVERYSLTELVNKLYLGGKDVPLRITKSHFSKPSSNHREKMTKICKT